MPVVAACNQKDQDKVTDQPGTETPDEPVLPVTFSVVFKDGSEVIENLSAGEGDVIEIASLEQKWPYDFIGWNTKEDNSGTNYEAGDKITLAGNLVLYAQWLYNENVRVRFDSPGETSRMPAAQILQPSGTITCPPNPVRLGYTFAGWSTETESFQEYNFDTPITEKDFRLYAHWQMEFLSLPVMTINLANDVPLSSVDRVTYIDSSISILNTEDEFLKNNLAAEFRGRGNGSWVGSDKKGYRIKFNTRQSMFDLPSNRHWVLSAAHGQDVMHLRNDLALSIARENLSGIEYSSSVTYIELFVNGNYHGVYHLLEHVRVDANRVNIESVYNQLDTGYLVEYTIYGDPESLVYSISSNAARGGGVEGIDYFKIEGLMHPFEVVSPDPDDHINEDFYKAQVRFIQAYIQQAVDAIIYGDWNTFEKMADVDSFVDMYILQELFKNYDAGYSSFYTYKKPGGKLYCGPAWDLGAHANNPYIRSPEGITVGTGTDWAPWHINSMFVSLYSTPQFYALVKDRWELISDEIKDAVNGGYDKVQVYADSFDRDAQRWGNSANWRDNQLALRNWLLTRIAWLDDEWKNVAPSHDFSQADQHCGKLLIWQAGPATNGAITRSFIELYNNSEVDINLSGYSVQIANNSGTNWNVIPLSGTIQAYTSFLILGDKGTTHADNRLFFEDSDADLLASFTIGNNQFKICLINSTSVLTIANPFNVGDMAVIQGYVDMVAAVNDTTIDAYAGSGPSPKMSKQQSVRRVSLENAHDNATDFINIDYRRANSTDDFVEDHRPRNQAFGAWNPTFFHN